MGSSYVSRPTPALVFDSGGLWRLSRELENHVFHLTSPMYGALPYKRATFSPDFTWGEVLLERSYFDPRDPVDALEYPLDELLMMNLLAHGRGVEVHACGLEDTDGQGYLFLGHSGAGKTTTARLWQKAGGVRVLSDDRIILRSSAGKTWMYGTPWHGEARLALPARTPLRQIFFLRHGTANEIVPLGCGEALARFLACSFVPFYSRSGLEFALAFFHQLIDSLPCAELRFVPEERADRVGPGVRGMNALDRSKVFLDVATNVLRSGYRMRFRAGGSSMWPTIRPGEAITVEPATAKRRSN